jgi:hypothetical protein
LFGETTAVDWYSLLLYLVAPDVFEGVDVGSDEEGDSPVVGHYRIYKATAVEVLAFLAPVLPPTPIVSVIVEVEIGPVP